METTTLAFISPFAKKFNKNLLASGNTIASPLGVWLLLTLSSTKIDQLDKGLVKRIEELLEFPLEDSSRRAIDLLQDPPESLKTAIGIWANRQTEEFSQWAKTVEDIVTTGISIPHQKDLDKWVETESQGLLSAFSPIPAGVEAVISSVIASKVSWSQELASVTAIESMRNWDTKNVLLSAVEQPVLLAEVEGKLYGVHVAFSNKGMLVYSVIAADKDSSPGDVMDVTYQIAQGKYEEVDCLAEAEKNTGDVFSTSYTTGARKASAFLPAWEAHATLMLNSISDSGADLLEEILANRGIKGDSKAVQKVKASYDKEGFQAAALIAMMVTKSFTTPKQHRQLIVSFSRPYASLAISRVQNDLVPTFNVWVDKAVEA